MEWIDSERLLDPAETHLMSMAFEELMEEIKALSPEQQQKLRDTLSQANSEEKLLDENSAEDVLNHRLAEAGITTEFKRRTQDREEFLNFTPITIQGKPLSETIIEERR